MAQERKQLDWRWVWAGAFVILVLLFFAVRSLTRERLQVRAVQVSRQELVSILSTNGRVEPEENYELHSPLATNVKAVYVQPGDAVPAGKVLAVLNDVEAQARVAAAESGVKSAQAAFDAVAHNGTLEQRQASQAEIVQDTLSRDQAQHNLDALVKLNATGAASASEVASARQQLAGAQATLDAAQAGARNRYSPADMARARAALSDAQANLAAAQSVEAQTILRAPIAGTVYSMDIQPTVFVQAGATLMQVADLRHLRVRAYFDEPDVGKVAVGQPVVVTWDAKPGLSWTGHIERVPATITNYQGTRNVGEVLVSLDGPDGQLLPDTNVTVKVTTSSQANTLSVPREALHREGGQDFVYRIVNGQLKRAPVTTGTVTITDAAILSGLKEGDWVATGSISGQPLQEDMPIRKVQ